MLAFLASFLIEIARLRVLRMPVSENMGLKPYGFDHLFSELPLFEKDMLSARRR